jgi:hypothetical protein
MSRYSHAASRLVLTFAMVLSLTAAGEISKTEHADFPPGSFWRRHHPSRSHRPPVLGLKSARRCLAAGAQ